MIVDLQDNGKILNDPQIHCLDKHRFGMGNLGEAGISMFFYSHHCNDHCKSLGLINPRHTGVLHPGFIIGFKLIPDPEERKIKKCKKCDKIYRKFRYSACWSMLKHCTSPDPCHQCQQDEREMKRAVIENRALVLNPENHVVR